jgi:hypothetical protein
MLVWHRSDICFIFDTNWFALLIAASRNYVSGSDLSAIGDNDSYPYIAKKGLIPKAE